MWLGGPDLHVERCDSLFETIASVVGDDLIINQDRYGVVSVKCLLSVALLKDATTNDVGQISILPMSLSNPRLGIICNPPSSHLTPGPKQPVASHPGP